MKLFFSGSDFTTSMQSLVTTLKGVTNVDVLSFDAGTDPGLAWLFDTGNRSLPHVQFRSDRDFAEIFNRLLSIALHDEKLEFGWYVGGCYEVSGELIYQLVSTHLLSINQRIRRRRTGIVDINRDFLVLSDLVAQAAKIKAGNKPLPEVHRLCVSDEQEAWRSVPPDPAIEHLVKTLNATGLIQTFGSCQGHFTHGRNPYVAFHAAENVASTVWRTICALHNQKALHHDWMISGSFDWKSRLVFSIQSERLAHGFGTMRAFVNYVVRRGLIDYDFKLLAEAINNSLKLNDNRVEKPRVVVPEKQPSTAYHACSQQHSSNASPDFLATNIPDWIGVRASRTCSHRIRSNLVRACSALFQSKRHFAFLSSLVWVPRPTTSLISETIVALTKPFRKSPVLHINSPVIVHTEDTPEVMRMFFRPTQSVLLPGGHRSYVSYSVSVAKRLNAPVRPMEGK